MTRSFLLHRRAPRLALPPLCLLLGLSLATTGCGGDGDAGAASSVSAATTAPFNPTLAAPGATVATTGATRPATPSSPSTTARPATTAPQNTAPPSTAATTTGGPTGQRLTGTVTASPTCPVERPDQPCAPRPVPGAHIEAFDGTERLVTSADADSEGRFALTLTPGRYVLTASSGAVFPSCPPLTVDVPASGAARADVTCDTGIR